MAINIIFIDRDGVLNENREDYVKSWDEVVIIPGVEDALRILKDNGYIIIITTDQSAVGRDYLTIDELEDIHKKLNSELGGYIDDFFYCPHLPKDDCGCRKPKTGLLDEAAKKYQVDLKDKWYIGDKTRDIELGKNAGMKTILVLTGESKEAPKDGPFKPDQVFKNLLDAVEWIVEIET
jgi:D-glycero-D-manno-heptose 1,7-bisphosphate phosphatase